jgi:2-polyprenyl-3-methyl-5-hydroxy-6-metoxy-1,4-benzoquinol methylase
MSEFNNHYEGKEGYGVSKRRLSAILFLLGNIKNKKIIDIGCGNGYLGKALKEKKAIVHGCDISNDAVSQAKKELDRAFQFDASSNNFEEIEEKYDIIISTELIEHLLEPEKFLENLKKILKPDGFIVLTTPNFLMWSNRIKMFLGKFEYRETGFWDRGHIHFFTYYSLKKVLKNLGYKIVEENNIPYRCPKLLAKIFPGFFVFQMVFKIEVEKK